MFQLQDYSYTFYQLLSNKEVENNCDVNTHFYTHTLRQGNCRIGIGIIVTCIIKFDNINYLQFLQLL